MRLSALSTLLAFTGLLAAAPTALAADPTSISPNLTTAGPTIDISQPVEGDLIVSGGTIRILAPVKGDILAAGGTIDVLEDVGGDIRAAGGTIRLHNAVGGEVSIFGGDVRFEPGSSVAQGARVVGWTVMHAGVIHGATMIAAGDVQIAGVIDGDAKIDGATMRFEKGGEVSGDLVYSTSAALPALDTVVKGKVTYLEQEDSSQGVFENVARGFNIFTLLTIVTTALILLLFLPNMSFGMANAMRRRPIMCVVAGVAVLFAFIPITLALVTTVGVPIAVAALSGWVAMMYLGFMDIFLALLIAELGLGLLRIRPTFAMRILAVAASAFVLMTLGKLPIVSVVVIIFDIIAIGAFILGFRDSMHVVPAVETLPSNSAFDQPIVRIVRDVPPETPFIVPRSSAPKPPVKNPPKSPTKPTLKRPLKGPKKRSI